MLDIRRIRNDYDAVRGGLARRGDEVMLDELDRVKQLDEQLRKLVSDRDDVRARVKAVSSEVGVLRRDGKPDEAEALQAESRELGQTEKDLDAEAGEVEAELRELLLGISNIPADDAPDGAGAADNPVLRVEGGLSADTRSDHQKIPHWEIGQELGILDIERAVKMSGSMFTMLRGQGATLARALCQAALDRNSDAFEEVRPPTLVLTDTMVSTGHLPKFIDEAYHLERDDLWAIPTAEVPLTSLARDEILDQTDLPMRLMAYTPSYRREAGSAGRDTRGLLRVHEFDKVEIFAYTTPDQAETMHGELLARAEGLVADLGLTYRIVDLCAGDIGNAAARTFDIEVYAPGVDMWLEVSSVSWFGDYQARRANVRYRPAGSKKPDVVHTLNGSALAVPRVWAALVETHRQADGSISVPAVLHPYLRGATAIPA